MGDQLDEEVLRRDHLAPRRQGVECQVVAATRQGCADLGGRTEPHHDVAGIPDDDAISFGASLARRKGLTIAMVRRMNEVYPRAIGLASRGVVDLGSVVTSRSGLGQVQEAFAEGVRRTGLKVIVEPQL